MSAKTCAEDQGLIRDKDDTSILSTRFVRIGSTCGRPLLTYPTPRQSVIPLVPARTHKARAPRQVLILREGLSYAARVPAGPCFPRQSVARKDVWIALQSTRRFGRWSTIWAVHTPLCILPIPRGIGMFASHHRQWRGPSTLAPRSGLTKSGRATVRPFSTSAGHSVNGLSPLSLSGRDLQFDFHIKVNVAYRCLTVNRNVLRVRNRLICLRPFTLSSLLYNASLSSSASAFFRYAGGDYYITNADYAMPIQDKL